MMLFRLCYFSWRRLKVPKREKLNSDDVWSKRPPMVRTANLGHTRALMIGIGFADTLKHRYVGTRREGIR